MALIACSPGSQDSEAVAEEPVELPEVVVFGGLEDVMAFLEGENWWGEEQRGNQLQVPHVMIAGISQNWRANANQLPVSQKKEIFYRFMLPLILHANEMVMERRAGLLEVRDKLAAGKALSALELDVLRSASVLLRATSMEKADTLTADSPEWPAIVDELLYKLDTIPPGLALGQAAYESGYGTSRFAAEGNALFGQWTYGGKGLVPGQQRKNLGDHRIAAFDWPFDSVRGYFLNLMSHPAYEDFRRLRAAARAAGRPLSSLELADGLIRYSERGQEYVDSLKGIIRVNKLDVADDAVFRDEPVRFAIGAESPEGKAAMEQEIQRLRASGELGEIIARMRLD